MLVQVFVELTRLEVFATSILCFYLETKSTFSLEVPDGAVPLVFILSSITSLRLYKKGIHDIPSVILIRILQKVSEYLK